MEETTGEIGNKNGEKVKDSSDEGERTRLI